MKYQSNPFTCSRHDKLQADVSVTERSWQQIGALHTAPSTFEKTHPRREGELWGFLY